jgi:hypothetical protein
LLFPLLEIEEGGHRLPLLYAEAAGRDAAGLPLALRLQREGEGWRLEEQSLDQQRQFRADCGLGPLSPPDQWRCAALDWVELELPPLGLPALPDRHVRESAWIEQVAAALRKHPSDAARYFMGAGCLMRGPAPLWVQDDQRPLDRRGRPMRFLLQADASRLTDQAPDIVQYLFISEDGQELAQVAQGS